MNILIISQSIVNGSIIENALKKEKQFQVFLSFFQDQSILNKINSEQKIDTIVLVINKKDENLVQQIHFLNNLFGVPIILLDGLNFSVESLPWLTHFRNFNFDITSSEFKAQVNKLMSLLKKEATSKSQTVIEESSTVLTEVSNKIPSNNFKLIAIGASTGGPQVLNQIFKNLSANIPVPILVVQHMPANFLPMFVAWLNRESPLTITIAKDRQHLEPGHVYFAPGDLHMILTKEARIKLLDAPPMHSVKPAVSYLFKSVAEVYGSKAIGILLTGMGKDGAAELRLIKEKGGLTIIQDKESCVVFGMPGSALKLEAAVLALPPFKIVEQLNKIFTSANRRKYNACK